MLTATIDAIRPTSAAALAISFIATLRAAT
jgi:hypothetical protein